MENQLNEKQNNEFYSQKGKKTGDLGNGILAGLGYVIFAFLIIISLKGNSAAILTAILIYLAGVVFYLFKRRGYFALGLVLIVVVPLAIFGGCMALLGGL